MQPSPSTWPPTTSSDCPDCWPNRHEHHPRAQSRAQSHQDQPTEPPTTVPNRDNRRNHNRTDQKSTRYRGFLNSLLEIAIDRPADIAWKKLSGFCDIGGWMKTTCVYTSGSGEVGTVRRIAGRIDELLVAKTAWSYSYAQPQSPIDYHGTVEVRPIWEMPYSA